MADVDALLDISISPEVSEVLRLEQEDGQQKVLLLPLPLLLLRSSLVLSAGPPERTWSLRQSWRKEGFL
jgi:hypothetical protein